MPAQIVPVIMCGGAGTRLWPVSRESMPKQFVPLVGPGSTFQQVLARISDPELFARPIVITNADFRFVVAEQLRERGIEADIVLEPMRRDSGPAVAVAAVLAAERDREALVLVLAADHVMRKPDEFREACRRAAAAAAEGRIVTFGIEPTHPATNYGYIRPGEQAQWRVRARGRGVRGEARRRDRGELRGGSLSLEQRQFPVSRRDHARRDRALRAGHGGGREGGGRRPHARSRFPAARSRAVRARAEEIDRLCGHGAHQARRRGSRRSRLVGRRQLEHGLGRARSRCRRQCDRRSGRHAGQPQQSRALGGIRADHRGRARRRHRRVDRGRRAGQRARTRPSR